MTGENQEFLGLFISRWQEIELKLRTFVAAKLGESFAQQPLSLLVSRLKEQGILTQEDALNLKQLLDLRNKVIHQGLELGPEEIIPAMRRADADPW